MECTPRSLSHSVIITEHGHTNLEGTASSELRLHDRAPGYKPAQQVVMPNTAGNYNAVVNVCFQDTCKCKEGHSEHTV